MLHVQVTLTDYEPAVLQCLWRSVGETAALGQKCDTEVASADRAAGSRVAATTENSASAGAAPASKSNNLSEAQPAPDVPSDTTSSPERPAGADSDTAFDPEDADSCDDLDDFLQSGLGLSAAAAGDVDADGPSQGWCLVSPFCCSPSLCWVRS